MEETKPKKKRKGWIILLVILGVLAGGIFGLLETNPRLQILYATLYLSEHTLKQPSYIAYNMDVMDLCRNYANGDVSFEGKMYLNQMKGFGFSSYMNVEGERSFSQRKMAAKAEMDVLWIDAGELDFYAQDQMAYMVAPMLDGMSNAFDTGQDLFLKAPELTSDIDTAWFRKNAGNIVQLMQEISLEETGETIEAEDGTVSREYIMTIPQGSGAFIWELLGMEMPDYDITAKIYLTPGFHISRVVMDLADIVQDGVSMTIDGEDMGTCIIDVLLPDDERAEIIATRDAEIEYTTKIDVDAAYYANTGMVYTATMYLSAEETEDGAEVDVRDIVVMQGEELLCKATFNGRITKEENLPDLFANVTTDLDSIEVLDWKSVRDDLDGFVNDMMDKAKATMDID